MKFRSGSKLLGAAATFALCLPALAQNAPGAAATAAVAKQSDWVGTVATQAKLDAGKVVLQSQFDAAHSAVSIDAAIRIHASPSAIWPLITRCDSASNMFRELKRCKELSSAADGSWAVVEHDLKLSVVLPLVHSVFRNDYQAPYRMDFHRVAGDMKYEAGSWLLQPSADGSSTTIEYRVALQPGFLVPHGLVRRSLKKQLPTALLTLRSRAEHPEAPPRVASSADEDGSDSADDTSDSGSAQSSE
jgi:hypothetical protein